jgi:hypothetical protein
MAVMMLTLIVSRVSPNSVSFAKICSGAVIRSICLQNAVFPFRLAQSQIRTCFAGSQH